MKAGTMLKAGIAVVFLAVLVTAAAVEDYLRGNRQRARRYYYDKPPARDWYDA